MNNIDDLIELPHASEIKEMLQATKVDVAAEIKENPELAPTSKLLTHVIEIIEEKLNKQKDLNKLPIREKIDIAAHLNFLQNLLEDFFFVEDEEMEMEEDDFEDDDDYEEINGIESDDEDDEDERR